MERQLANLTGLVQKALIQTVPPTSNINQNYLGVPGQYRGKFPILCRNILFSFKFVHLKLKLKTEGTFSTKRIGLIYIFKKIVHHCLTVI